MDHNVRNVNDFLIPFARGSDQHLYVVCIYGAILFVYKSPKKCPPDPPAFSPGSEIPIYSMLCSNLCKNFRI